MSSGGFGLVEGLGWVCLTVAHELGLSVAEIASGVRDAHDIVFRQTALRFQQRSLERIEKADQEWKALCAERAKRLAPIRTSITSAYRSVERDSSALTQLHQSAVSGRDTVSEARSIAIARLREIHSGVREAGISLASAPLPASNELQPIATAQAQSVRTASASMVNVGREISQARSLQAVRTAEQKIKPVEQTARRAIRQVGSYTAKARKAHEDYSAAAEALTRARVGLALLVETPYPDKAKQAAERITGPVASVESKLVQTQRSLASGQLSGAVSAAKRMESQIEQAQKKALATTVSIAAKQRSRAEEISGRIIDVDTSGSVVVLVKDPAESGTKTEQLKTLIDEVQKTSVNATSDYARRDSDRKKKRSNSSRRQSA